MNAKRVDRTQDCTASEARVRLRQAELYLEVADMVLSSESAEHATVAAGNAVLAAIAASDAICCAGAGQRYRGADHRRAVDHLEHVTGDKKLAGYLRDVLDAKDAGHYGLDDIVQSRAKSALRKAIQIVDAAKMRVR